MAVRGAGRLRVAAKARREPLVASAVMAMLIFVVMEVMFFAGLISAFAIIKAGAMVWPPPDQPRLPLERTALNTTALLASGAALLLARRAFRRRSRASVEGLLLAAIALGAGFVLFQGVEWVALIRQGLTLTSSSLGSFFYLIVGLHALHAVIALGLLVYTWVRLRRGWLASSQLATAEIFWYFVVFVWPVLYLTVYL